MISQVDFVIENIIAKCMKDNTPKNVQFIFLRSRFLFVNHEYLK